MQTIPHQFPVFLEEGAEVAPPSNDLRAAEIEVDGVGEVVGPHHADGVLDGAPEGLGVVCAELHDQGPVALAGLQRRLKSNHHQKQHELWEPIIGGKLHLIEWRGVFSQYH